MSRSTTISIALDEDAYLVFQNASEIVSNPTFADFGGLKISCVILL
jgi:hypothetical protein